MKLAVQYDEPPSNFDFNFNLRPYTSASGDKTVRVWDASTWLEVAKLEGHTKVGRCRLTLS